MLPENSDKDSYPFPPLSIYKKIDFAILSPMPEELEFLEKYFFSYPYRIVEHNGLAFKIYEYNKKYILLSYTGLGTSFAAALATMICHRFNPSYFLLLGTAGGINPKLSIRDVIIVEKAFEAEIQDIFTLLKGTPFESCLTYPLNKKTIPPIFSSDEKLLAVASSIDFENIQVFKGTVVTSNTFPAPKELFEKIKMKSPYAIDMETSAIYQTAQWLLGIPTLAIRAISNILNSDGTDDKINEFDVKGSMERASIVLLKILNKLISDTQATEISKNITSHSNNIQEANDIINYLKLQPHPEGGYYRRVYESAHWITSQDKDRYNNALRKAGSSIYYLLKETEFSAWHRIKSDEIWHYYKGSPIKIYSINEQGILITYLLGDPSINENAIFQAAIPADTWFAAELIDQTSFSLIGCTVSPGFEFNDWEIGNRNVLIKKFPQHESIIRKFTLLSSALVSSLIQ